MNDNQHFITKAHLDKFVHPTSPQKVLYPYTKRRGAQRKARGTKRLASADHFYRQIESGQPTNMLDEARKVSEQLFFGSGRSTCAPLAKCIYDENYLPAPEERIMLEGAAAFLRCGAPVQIHNTAMIGLLASQQWLFNELNSDEVIEKYKAQYRDDAENQWNEAKDAIYKGEVRAEVGKENWKQLGFDSFTFETLWLEGLARMGLTICTSHSKSFFLTSDNPVVLRSYFQPDNPGLGVKDAEVWFPISYNHGLLWSRKHLGIHKTTLGYAATCDYNRQIIKWCYREVYSPLPGDWINEAVKEATFDPCYGHYGSLEKVLQHSFHARIGPPGPKGRKGEVVDILAALRAGEKCDVVRLPAGKSIAAS
jgi:Protein of unknown function (DUF4238)